MSALLEARERTRLAAVTNCAEETIERVIAAAAAEGLVVVLPAFAVAAEFAGWETFVYDGQAKAAHVAEVGAYRALCGAPRPALRATSEPRTRLCVGCEGRVRALVVRPGGIAEYKRGDEPAPLRDALLPVLRRARPDAPTDARAPRVAARPARAPRVPPSPPPPVSEPPRAAAPSLFDVPAGSVRRGN